MPSGPQKKETEKRGLSTLHRGRETTTFELESGCKVITPISGLYTMSYRRPDAVVSSFAVKSEDITSSNADPSVDDFARDAAEDDDDPVVREIDVYLSPSLSNTLHLLQFPIQPVASVLQKNTRCDTSNNPTEAKFRPRHHMLELEYPIPPNAQAGHRQVIKFAQNSEVLVS